MTIITKNGYLMLFIAIIFEVLGTLSMKLSDGFTFLFPSIFMVFFYITSLFFLNYALAMMQVSVAYAISSGAGTAIIAALGIYYFNESLSFIKILALLAIIAGVIGLNITQDI